MKATVSNTPNQESTVPDADAVQESTAPDADEVHGQENSPNNDPEAASNEAEKEQDEEAEKEGEKEKEVEKENESTLVVESRISDKIVVSFKHIFA